MQRDEKLAGTDASSMPGVNTVMFSCSGASNCGQIANQVAMKLDEAGRGKFFCIAGVGAHNEKMIQSAKGAQRIVVMDGCATACARNSAQHAGLKVNDWVCITDIGIKKVHQFTVSHQDIERAEEHVIKMIDTGRKNGK
jgi:uncharacterized metal-binding protein